MSKKIKILIGCLLFKELTGSEMYVYELAKGLIKLNYDVSVISQNIGGRLTNLAISNGIKVYHTSTPPVTEYFDLIHCQHYHITDFLIRLFPLSKKISTIHSELNSEENPINHISIFKYIAIRPQIKDHIVNNFNIPEKKIEIIYNPIDENRFKVLDNPSENFLLFVGSLEHLRKEPLFDLVKYTREINQELWIVGTNHSNYLQDLLKNEHVKYFESALEIEEFIHRCSQTAGILLGRTTIEGWMCGKPGWIYNVDVTGKIIDKKLYEVPDDIEKYYSTNVVKQISEIYIEVLNTKIINY